MAGEGPAIEIRRGFVGSFKLWLRVQVGRLIPDVGLIAKQSLVLILPLSKTILKGSFQLCSDTLRRRELEYCKEIQ